MIREWYLPLLGGLLPVMLLGFLASALANRLAFAGWALAFGLAYTLWLRIGLERAWPRRRRVAGALTLLALAALVLGLLVWRHGEIYDLGFRAALPSLYHPLWTRPASAWVVALVLTLAASWRYFLAAEER
ncbi:MAG: hypothetical protein AAF604_02430 [Acidobacteriota bacterium]